MGGVSFGFWKVEDAQKKGNTLKSRCLKFDIVEEKNDIKLENSYPITDEEAKKLTPYTFAIENQCEENINYTVKMEQLQKEREELLSSQYVAIEINGGQKEILGEYKEGKSTYEGNEYTSVEARELVKGTLKGKEKREYAIKIWIDEKVSEKDNAMNKSFISKIVVDGTMNEEYNEPILHGTDPVLKEGLIPVTIDNKGTVRKAKLTEEWYNYANQEWANAIILAGDKTADNYQDNQIIPEADIESYFVWIPKYQYRLFNTNNFNYNANGDVSEPQIINIKFGTTNTNDKKEDECTTPKESGQIGNCQNGDWMTHPAFLAFDTKGIWVGKFETGYKGATSASMAQHNENSSNKVIIKPNVYSWRNIQVSNAYLTSIGYKTDLNSHMMKNTEWGAVAYLQQSLYGSHESVRINNNSSLLTGYSAKEEPTCGWTNTNESCNKFETVNKGIGKDAQDGEYSLNYFNAASVLSSTTGNYTGIYDMSGGTAEYMMSVIEDQKGNPVSGRHDVYNSGFNGILTCPTCKDTNVTPGGKTEITDGEVFPTDARYYDTYVYSTNPNDYTRGILGDATSELGPFKNESYSASNGTKQIRQISGYYKDYVYPVYFDVPWISRGGYISYGFNSGIFTAYRDYGAAYSGYGFRITLAFTS